MKKATPSTREKRRDDTVGPLTDPEHLEGTQILDPTEPVQDDENSSEVTGGRRTALAKPERPNSLFERVESIFRMVSLLAITASVVLTAFQFYQGRIDEQKERSVLLMNKWQVSEERSALARLSAALEERLESLDTIRGQVTPAAMQELKYLIGKSLVEDWAAEANYEKRVNDVGSIFNFYSEVEFCIRAGLCDAPLLTSYFGDEAISFWEYFRAFAEKRRKSFFPDYGKALETFVSDLEK